MAGRKEVIAVDLKVKVPKETAYKASNGKWYSSEEAYNRIQENILYRNKCTELVAQLLELENSQIISTYWFKRLKEFENYPTKVVYATLCGCFDSIQNAFALKSFDKEMYKISYIIACISNNINDSYQRMRKKEKMERLAENHKEIIDIEVAEPVKQNNHDISSFLE